MQRWLKDPEAGKTSARAASDPSSVVFVDQQRRPGQRLSHFTILGETENESARRFLVKLFLVEPDESVLAGYYVFGVDPVWVYRCEDLDMIMHWEHQMGPDANQPGDAPKPDSTRR